LLIICFVGLGECYKYKDILQTSTKYNLLRILP